MKATWNGHTIAESDDIVTVEGNAYFPSAKPRQIARPTQPAHLGVRLEGHRSLLLARR